MKPCPRPNFGVRGPSHNFRRKVLVSIASLISISASASAREYDAEADIGLVAESPAAAASNTQRLSAALEAQWSGGKFHFATGQIGPVLDPIRASAKEFFFAGTIETSKRVGGCVLGFGTRSYPLPSGHYNAGGTLGGATTRFTRVDGERGGAVLRLRGAAFRVEGIEFRGRPYIFDPTGEGPREGAKTPVGIEVEGRNSPATGQHIIRNCTITECTYGICARAGYYEAGKFITQENHADNSIVDGVLFHTVESCFRSENQQAVVWSFRDIFVSTPGGGGLNHTVVCDIIRGGNIAIDGLSLNHPQATIFKVRDYNPGNHRLVCNNLRWDAYTAPTDYLTLFHYDGPLFKNMSSLKWSVRVSGHLVHSEQPPYDHSKLLRVPPALPRDDIKFDISRLPEINP